MLITKNDHPYFEVVSTWLKSLPKNSVLEWSSYAFNNDSFFHDHSVPVQLIGFTPPAQEEKERYRYALNFGADAALFADSEEPRADGSVSFDELKRSMHPELPVFLEPNCKLNVEYDKKRWPIAASLEDITTGEKQSLDLTQKYIIKFLTDLEYWNVERGVKIYTLDKITEALDQFIQDLTGRTDLKLQLRRKDTPDFVDPYELEYSRSRQEMLEMITNLPQGATIQWGSDHLGPTMPYNHGVEIDLIVDLDEHQEARFDRFINIERTPHSPSHSLSIDENVFAPFNANYYFTLNDKDELVDCYLQDDQGKKQLVLPTNVKSLKFEVQNITPESVNETGRLYKREVYTPEYVSLLVARWIFEQVGRNDLKVKWNFEAEPSAMFKNVLERLEERDELEGRKITESLEIAEDIKVSPEVMDFLLSLGMEKAGEVMKEHRNVLEANSKPVVYKI